MPLLGNMVWRRWSMQPLSYSHVQFRWSKLKRSCSATDRWCPSSEQRIQSRSSLDTQPGLVCPLDQFASAEQILKLIIDDYLLRIQCNALCWCRRHFIRKHIRVTWIIFWRLVRKEPRFKVAIPGIDSWAFLGNCGDGIWDDWNTWSISWFWKD